MSGWGATALPAVLLPNVLDEAHASEIRARLERAGYTQYAILDRGRYDGIDNVDLPDLISAIASRASDVTGRALAARSARVVRLGPGGYVLLRHDRVHEDRPVEAVLDLSPAAVPNAEVHYRHRGQLFFSVPTMPGALALVERGPTVMCNHTYVSKLHRAASVVRLLVLLV